jgi:hypothetical protein
LSLDYGITREPVRRIGRVGVAKVRRWSASAEFADVAAAAATLRDELGPIIAFDAVPASFRPQGQPPRMTPEAALLVYLAGPYDVQGQRLVRRNFMGEVGVAVGDVMAASCVAPLHEVTDALDGLGVGDDDRTVVLSKLSGYRLQGEYLLRWSGTQADKAVAVLTAEGHPLTLIAISGNIPERHAIRSLQNCLGSDRRFQRAGPKNWALSAWGGEQYPGTLPAMVAELETRGGSATIVDLAAVLSDRFDISRKAVSVCAGTSPSLVRMGSRVRLRRADEPYVSHESLGGTANCFVVDGAWAWRVVVDHDLLRGSGRQLPEAFATHLGLHPGLHLQFDSPVKPISIGWGIRYASIGSLRVVALATGAQAGDLLFVRAAGPSRFDFTVVTQTQLEGVAAPERIALLCGNPAPFGDVTTGLAIALGFPDPADAAPEAVVSTLSARHDHDMLRAFTESTDA